jgi:hypothetical protein
MMRHAVMMDAFYAAREHWRDQAEAASCGHTTEMAEYVQDNPPPRLRDFMKGTF